LKIDLTKSEIQFLDYLAKSHDGLQNIKLYDVGGWGVDSPIYFNPEFIKYLKDKLTIKLVFKHKKYGRKKNAL